jgi:hypothetical protein
MTTDLMTALIFAAGLGQASLLIASSLVPSRLHWREELQSLPRLHRQMHWVYGGYVLLSIIAFALLSTIYARELAAGGGLARGVCAYIAVFWAVRLGLQGVFDVKAYLTAWWMKAGYVALTMLFASFTIVYGLASLGLAS